MINTTKNWTTTVGVCLTGLSVIAFITIGWIFWTYLLLMFPSEVLHGQARLEEWFIAVYGIEIPILFITGISLLKRHRFALPLTIATTFVTCIVAGIWFSVGNWTWETFINRGSAQPILMYGKHILRNGDYLNPAYRINPQIWMAKMGLLTVIFAIIIVVLIKFWPRYNTKEISE